LQPEGRPLINKSVSSIDQRQNTGNTEPSSRMKNPSIARAAVRTAGKLGVMRDNRVRAGTVSDLGVV
jgi:hypothetical protein